ncbi:tyrosine-type recombinase/integrase [Acetobacter sp. DsW_063]|uniref:tyrosine-type recombinase/integrase n=1 Tax=Acetobacter sp. DsW_063 TaxID=1514894 RepID=UPI000A36D760|nr:tyrosine-type recombinase/integrase [Acetobacter sp. DsW_063]OUJ15025.1 hypothetical protein HK28_10550 [Acetobacter sp. DsW_063]
MSEPPFTLFKQPKSANFYVRFYTLGREIRRSLGTSDERDALKRAHLEYGRYVARAEMGLDGRDPTINSLIPRYERYLDGKVERRRMTALRAKQHKRVVQLYLAQFCGDKPVSYLSAKTIDDFMNWRMTYWTSGPGTQITKQTILRCGKPVTRRINPKIKTIPAATTQQMEQSGLYIFLNWLHDEKLIADRIQFRYADKQHVARPAFSTDELKSFFHAIGLRQISASTADADYRSSYKWKMFFDYCMFMLETGLRPTEARTLKWKHIIGFDYETVMPQMISIRVQGKGKHRTTIPLPQVAITLAGVWTNFKFMHNTAPDPEDYIFANSKRKITEDMDRFMNVILKDSALERDYLGTKRTTYSFRHTHITEQIVDRVDYYSLAKNLGTSVDMIRKHYDHSTIEQHREALIPKKWRDYSQNS